jgi:hypothetical protein
VTDLDRFTVRDSIIGKALKDAYASYTQANPQEKFDEKAFFKGYDEAKLRNSQRYVGRGGVRYYDNENAARYMYKRVPELGIRMITQFIQLKSDYLTSSSEDVRSTDLANFIQQQHPDWSRANIEKLDELDQSYLALVGISRQK